jgi:hypothetical protein
MAAHRCIKCGGAWVKEMLMRDDYIERCLNCGCRKEHFTHAHYYFKGYSHAEDIYGFKLTRCETRNIKRKCSKFETQTIQKGEKRNA